MNTSVEKLQKRIALLQTIDAHQSSNWGVMRAQNMVEHLGGVFYATAKGLGGPVIYEPEKAAKIKARFMDAYYPFPQNARMPGTQDKPVEVPPVKYTSIEEAKEKLQKAVDFFIQNLESNPDKTASHGYFGDLTLGEWLHFHVKHVEHHLMQFGLLPLADSKIPLLEKYVYKAMTQIDVDTPAKWGLMNAHQMIEHLSLVFVLSTGKFNITYTGTKEDAEKYWKGFLESSKPWETVFPRGKFGDPRPTRFDTIEASKGMLKKSFKKYLAYCEENPDAIHPHFFVGDLTVDQWRQMHVKHLEHHLRQFGVIE